MTQKKITKLDKNRLYLAGNQKIFGVTLNLICLANLFCVIYPDFRPDNLNTDFKEPLPQRLH